MTFKTAAKNTQVESRTNNGMKTYDSSLNACVDLFFAIGASRGQDVTAKFERAFQEDAETASKILLWSRDVREGAGERQIFRDMLVNIEANHPKYLGPIINATPELGRWDDLLVLKSKNGQTQAFDLIKDALESGDSLCAKWMPRKSTKTDYTAAKLRNHLGWSHKQYRKTLVDLTKVVETNMCAKDFDNINFSHVPSLASARYQTAFHRNAPVNYQVYKDNLTKNDGSAKVNAGAVYPYDVLKSLQTDTTVGKAQWDALPNYLGDDAILPMVDVSGSMGSPVGGSKSLTCMDVALSLGLYVADKSTGAFKDMFLTFSANSKIEVLGGDITAKLRQLQQSDWSMNTDLNKAFAEVLRVAIEHKVDASDMPKYILILSDMEFDASQRHSGWGGVHGGEITKYDESAIEMIARQYEDASYEVPKLVFWNLHASNEKNAPVRFDQKGVALVSGFSPAIMKSVLKAEQFTPRDIMLDTIDVPRYDIFK